MTTSSRDLHPEWVAWMDSLRAKANAETANVIGKDATRWSECGRGQYKCCSPLRKEKTPSFYIYPDGSWHDFGTNESGDLFKYVQLRDGVDFRVAVDIVAEAVGHPTWARSKKARGAAPDDPETLLQLWREVMDEERFFAMVTDIAYVCHQALPSEVRAYLRRHYGLYDWVIDFQKIGWIPAGLWEICLERFLGKYTEEELLASGFFIRTSRGVETHRAQRIVFFYWRAGIVRYSIARHYFGAAGAENTLLAPYDAGKYQKHLTWSAKHDYVSAYLKNDVLWGEDHVRFARGETLIVTEGMTDAQILAQLGFHPLSPVTTSFSNKDTDHVVRLARGVKEVVILNDADILDDGTEPGKKGALRMAGKLWAANLHVRIGRLPKPDGVAKTDVNEIAALALGAGPGGGEPDEHREGEAHATIQAIVDAAEPLPEFLVAEIPLDASFTTIEKHLHEIGAVAARLSALQRSDLLAKVCARFKRVPRVDARRAINLGAALALDAAKKEAKAEAAKEAKDEKAHRVAEGNYDAIPPFKGRIKESIGFYERECADGSVERISNFSLVCTRTLAAMTPGPDRVCVRVTGVGNAALVPEWIVPVNAWWSKRNFISTLPHNDMRWSGTDDEVQGLAEILTTTRGPVPRVHGTSVMGMHAMPDGTMRCVVPAGTIDRDGWMDNPDIVFVPDGGSSLQTKLPFHKTPFDDAGRELLREVLTELPHLHDPLVVQPLAGLFLLTLFRAELLAGHGHSGFALMQVHGSPGSGKTSLMTDLLWRVFNGVEREEPLSAAQTPFAMIKDLASTNAFVLVFDELKLDMGPRRAEENRRFARRAYNGDTESRGRADQTVSNYRFQSGWCQGGEMKFEEDAALAERTATFHLNKNWLPAHPDAQRRFRALIRKPLHRVAHEIWRWRLTADLGALLAAAEAQADALLQAIKILPPVRIRLTIVQTLAGLRALDALCEAFGAPVPARDEAAIVRALLVEALDLDELPGADGPMLVLQARNAFDHFVADAATFALAGQIHEGALYSFLRDPVTQRVTLFLYVRGIEITRDTVRRARGLPGVSPGERSLYRIAGEMEARGDSYILHARHKLTMVVDGKEVRANGVLLDPERLPDGVSFPKALIERQSGGTSIPWAVAARLVGNGNGPAN